MIVGIRKNIKQPIAHFFSSGFVTADRLAVVLKEVMILLKMYYVYSILDRTMLVTAYEIQLLFIMVKALLHLDAS